MSATTEVWIVDDDASIRWVLERAFEAEGLRWRSFERADAALEALRSGAPDVLMTDIRMPGRNGLQFLEDARGLKPAIPVIVMTAHTDLENAVAAYQGGAFEYLPKPFDLDRAVDLVRRAASQNQGDATAAPEEGRRIPEMLGSAPAMQALFRAIGRLSRSSMTVLITGESGTGKELVARALHRHSPRAAGPFIALNTSAFAAELLESELFGHEKGAFTGADQLRRGRFEQAESGTLFLDEIGDMSPALQTRLLRVLAEGEFYRVGGQTPIRTNVRVIAATHQDLEARVASGAFREDLLHRLNVIHLQTPPLRARREDIPELLRHYLEVAARELNMQPKALSPAAAQALVRLDWPGNVRQLVNACRRLTALAAGREIGPQDLPADLGGERREMAELEWERQFDAWAAQQLNSGERGLFKFILPRLERRLMETALRYTRGRIIEASKLLGWGRNTMTRKMQAHRIKGGHSAGPETEE